MPMVAVEIIFGFRDANHTPVLTDRKLLIIPDTNGIPEKIRAKWYTQK
jgi:hypothetical protein